MMHPVVQDWCLHVASIDLKARNNRCHELALVSVGHAIPDWDEQAIASSEHAIISADDCFDLRLRLEIQANYTRQFWMSDNLTDNTMILDAIHSFGHLYASFSMFKEAETMYLRAIAGYEKILDPDHISITDTVHHLGVLYMNQGM